LAVASKRRVVVNSPGRRRSKSRRRNLSDKQIAIFGSKQQKAALKRRRSMARSNSHRKRSNSVQRTIHRAKSYSRRKSHRRKNPGDILSLVLNPGGTKKGKSMAAPKRRKYRSSDRRHNRRRRSASNPHRRRRHHSYGHRSNPMRRHRRIRRRNAGGATGGLQSNMMMLVAGAAGFFGSKVLTQAVMGASNTGVVGYFGNAIATGGLALVAYMLKFKKAAAAILAGGVLQIAARAVTDYTPFGQFTSSLGVGDYQMQSFVTPQRLVDPLGSAQIEIPPAWAPQVVTTAAPPGGVHGYNRTGGGTYSGGGLYAT
jgi:hypothetical protein